MVRVPGVADPKYHIGSSSSSDPSKQYVLQGLQVDRATSLRLRNDYNEYRPDVTDHCSRITPCISQVDHSLIYTQRAPETLVDHTARPGQSQPLEEKHHFIFRQLYYL